jgi:hypothetical protein
LARLASELLGMIEMSFHLKEVLGETTIRHKAKNITLDTDFNPTLKAKLAHEIFQFSQNGSDKIEIDGFYVEKKAAYYLISLV